MLASVGISGDSDIVVGTGVSSIFVVVVLKAYGVEVLDLKCEGVVDLAGRMQNDISDPSTFATTTQEGKVRRNSVPSANCDHPR